MDVLLRLEFPHDLALVVPDPLVALTARAVLQERLVTLHAPADKPVSPTAHVLTPARAHSRAPQVRCAKVEVV